MQPRLSADRRAGTGLYAFVECSPALSERVLRDFMAGQDAPKPPEHLQVTEELRRKGVVVGLSGGIDSAVTAALCVRALGKDRVFGLFMPECVRSIGCGHGQIVPARPAAVCAVLHTRRSGSGRAVTAKIATCNCAGWFGSF